MFAELLLQVITLALLLAIILVSITLLLGHPPRIK